MFGLISESFGTMPYFTSPGHPEFHALLAIIGKIHYSLPGGGATSPWWGIFSELQREGGAKIFQQAARGRGEKFSTRHEGGNFQSSIFWNPWLG